jgi:competence protein ComEC
MAEKEFNQATKVHPSLSTSNSGNVVLEKTSLEVLHPQADMCLTGVGNVDIKGRKVNANSMSAVLLVQHDGKRICLLAADADRDSLDRMIDFGADLSAKVLVFPHHGGRPGSRDGKAFARDLVSRVAPEVVLFSLGRGAHGTPRPEIMAGVKEAIVPLVTPYIACTQLSERCARKLPTASTRQIDSRSDGFKEGKCCAGTVSIPLTDDGLDKFLGQLRSEHASFIRREVPGALCLKGIQ